jgi:hypothetical protein
MYVPGFVRINVKLYISPMKNPLLITGLLFSSVLNAQIIDWTNFSEERMNTVMFFEMNKYVKSLDRIDSVKISPIDPKSKYRTIDWRDIGKSDRQLILEGAKWHRGDSLILSSVVQQDIMARNLNFIRNNHTLPIYCLHNMEWKIPGRGNDLNDTLRAKIIKENANPNLLKNKLMAEFNCYGLFTYTEILECASYQGSEEDNTYQGVAIQFIQGWNSSPSHAGWMNANYQNKVIVGVATYYDYETKTIYVSFVHIS